MRVAVTGASGLLGRFVMAAAEAAGCEVAPVDLVPCPGRDTALADVLDPDALARAMRGCDAVVHLAGLDQVRTAPDQAFFATNALGTWNVLMVAEQLGMRRAVVCSSVAALGLRPEAPPATLPILVDHPLRPVSAYGVSKQAAEIAASAFARRGAVQVVCLRPALVAFPHQLPGWATAAAAVDGMPPAGLPPDAPPAPEPVPLTCAYVGPEDAGRAFAAALRAEAGGFVTLYVTAQDTMSVRPTVELLADRLACRPPVTRPELYGRLPQASPFDLEPTRRVLGWSPRGRWADLVAHHALPADD